MTYMYAKIRTTYYIKRGKQWYFVTKIVLTYSEKKCSSDLKNFANSWPSASNFKSFSRSLEEFIQAVKGQNNFW
jgi:hypothetical protein